MRVEDKSHRLSVYLSLSPFVVIGRILPVIVEPYSNHAMLPIYLQNTYAPYSPKKYAVINIRVMSIQVDTAPTFAALCGAIVFSV